MRGGVRNESSFRNESSSPFSGVNTHPNTSRESSYLKCALTVVEQKRQMAAEAAPMNAADPRPTTPAAGVMAASPAMQPVMRPSAVGLPATGQSL